MSGPPSKATPTSKKAASREGVSISRVRTENVRTKSPVQRTVSEDRWSRRPPLGDDTRLGANNYGAASGSNSRAGITTNTCRGCDVTQTKIRASCRGSPGRAIAASRSCSSADSLVRQTEAASSARRTSSIQITPGPSVRHQDHGATHSRSRSASQIIANRGDRPVRRYWRDSSDVGCSLSQSRGSIVISGINITPLYGTGVSLGSSGTAVGSAAPIELDGCARRVSADAHVVTDAPLRRSSRVRSLSETVTLDRHLSSASLKKRSVPSFNAFLSAASHSAKGPEATRPSISQAADLFADASALARDTAARRSVRPSLGTTTTEAQPSSSVTKRAGAKAIPDVGSPANTATVSPRINGDAVPGSYFRKMPHVTVSAAATPGAVARLDNRPYSTAVGSDLPTSPVESQLASPTFLATLLADGGEVPEEGVGIDIEASSESGPVTSGASSPFSPLTASEVSTMARLTRKNFYRRCDVALVMADEPLETASAPEVPTRALHPTIESRSVKTEYPGMYIALL